MKICNRKIYIKIMYWEIYLKKHTSDKLKMQYIEM